MRSYPEYRDVDVGWADRLPAHWEMRRAKRIFAGKDRPAEENDGVVTAFRDGEVTLRENRRTEGYTESLTKNNYQGIRKGDLVIHSMDAFAGAIGVSDSDGQASPVYVVCRPENEDEVDVHFYKYLLRHMAWSGYIESLARGIRERSSDFRYSEFANQFLPVPPLQEQRAIAEELDEQIARIDEYIAKKRELIDLLERQRRTVINRAVTRGLDDGVEMTDSGVGWLGEIPAHWEQIRLKYLTEEIIDAEHKTAPAHSDGDYLVVRTSNIRDGRLVLDDAYYTNEEVFREWTERGVPQPGDILFTREAPAGEACLVPEDVPLCLGQRVVCIRVDAEKLDASFAMRILNSNLTDEFIRVSSRGATVDHFNMSDIGKIPFLVPPVKEQKRIVNHIDERTSEIDDAIEQAERQIELMEQYRTSLVAEVVTGQVDVRDPVAV